MRRARERGAALAVTLIAITALLGLGALTVLSVQTEMSSAGQSRFSQSALYAAESGASAGMDFLRTHCSPTGEFFSAWVSPSNANPPQPSDLVGNNVHPGQTNNPFDAQAQMWYSVSILNNTEDPGYVGGQDVDGVVILHSVGYGPDQTVAAIELTVVNQSCVTTFCEHEYAQRNVTSRNDANAACSSRVTSSTLRQFNTNAPAPPPPGP